MENFYDELVKVLKKDKRFFSEDGALLRNTVSEAGNRLDRDLLRMLLGNKATKKHLFADVDGTMVFDKVKFGWVVNNREFLPDSYTRFKNKIGLVDERGEFISDSRDVSLVFPYKDCVLEGGQTKEEQKRDEIFYNETLAPNEVDRLLAPKVLTNAVRYDAKGKKTTKEFDAEKDNLIIKGNNLLALAVLRCKYARRFKLIYIDPPFNTGDDGFDYNDKFNHSTWLVFMRNRLTLAKELLSKNGFMCVNIGNEEVSYLKVLMDEIFKPENFVNHITMSTNDPSGFKATGSCVFSTANHLLIYSCSEEAKLNKIFVRKEYDENYSKVVLNRDENYTKWRFSTIQDELSKKLKLSVAEFRKKYSAQARYDLFAEYANDNRDKVFRTAAIGGGALAKRRETIKKSKENHGVVYCHPNEDVKDFYILNGEGIVFWGSLYREIDGDFVPAMAVTDVWTDIKWTGISGEGGVKLKNGKKPELLLKRILELTTEANDCVLDYHLGSGTTVAVAQKMNRQFVGIEQLDYGENDSVVRQQNVISGEQSGVSKLVNWKGGGAFVYCELLQNNERFVDRIRGAKKDGELLLVWKDVQKTGFISCKYNPKKKLDFADAEFKTLTLEEKKKVLMSLLDKNQLYVNLCDMDDAEFGVSAADKAFTNSFYGRK